MVALLGLFVVFPVTGSPSSKLTSVTENEQASFLPDSAESTRALEPLYGTAALPPNGSNTSFFSNAEFDRLIAEGNRAASNEEAIENYQAAEDLLLEEMPVAPMFFGQVQAVHSERVEDVVVDAFGTIQLADVTVVG